jgi:hypothetical protein
MSGKVTSRVLAFKPSAIEMVNCEKWNRKVGGSFFPSLIRWGGFKRIIAQS